MAMSAQMQKLQWILLVRDLTDDPEANSKLLASVGVQRVELTPQEAAAWIKAYRSLSQPPQPVSPETRQRLLATYFPKYNSLSDAEKSDAGSLSQMAFMELDFFMILRIFEMDEHRFTTFKGKTNLEELALSRYLYGSPFGTVRAGDMKSLMLVCLVLRGLYALGGSLVITRENYDTLLDPANEKSLLYRPALIQLLAECSVDFTSPIYSDMSLLDLLAAVPVVRAEITQSLSLMIRSTDSERLAPFFSGLPLSQLLEACPSFRKSIEPIVRSVYDKMKPVIGNKTDFDTLRVLAGESSLIGIENGHLSLTTRLVNTIIGRTRRSMLHYEARNIIERWILSMAKAVSDGTCKMEQPSDAVLFCVSDMEEHFNQKMMEEMITKSVVDSRTSGWQLTKEMVGMVNEHFLIGRTRNGIISPSAPKYRVGDVIQCASMTIEASPRIVALQKKASVADVVRMAMRYKATIHGGQQWGLPQKHADELYNKFGFRNEGFASPMNSRFAGKSGGKFCSLFPDTDTVFGSLGDFFKVDLLQHPGHWAINPPFILNVLDQSVVKVEETLAKCKQQLLVIMLVPTWLDAQFHIDLRKSRYKVHETSLIKRRYQFELPSSELIVASVNCSYFLLSAKPMELGLKKSLIASMERVNDLKPPGL